MRNAIFISLIIALIIGSCCQEKKSPIKGAWNLVYGSWPTVMEQTYPAQVSGGQVKMYTEKYFSHVGQLKLDTIIDNDGCGSYTLNGNQFEEIIIYRHGGTDQGKIIRLLVDVRNDTLMLRWPVGENWKLAEKFNIEKYVRLD